MSDAFGLLSRIFFDAMHIILLTLEHLNRSLPLSGGALRVAGLKRVLEDAGHQVTVLRESGVPPVEGEVLFDFLERREDGYIRTNIREKVEALNPDLVLAEQWGILDQLELPEEIPLICDLHGSLILENQARGYEDPYQVRAKILALSRCDAIITPSRRQLWYFQAFALAAGMDLKSNPVLRVPLVLPPEWYAHLRHDQRELALGGALWPWVEHHLQEEIRAAILRQGFTLRESTYEPSSRALSPGQIGGGRQGGMGHEDWVQALKSCQGAWDFYALNPERRLAVTTRTVEYLYCGLPPIYNEGLELSEVLGEKEIGLISSNPLELVQSPGFGERLQRAREKLWACSFLKDCRKEANEVLLPLVERLRPRTSRQGPIASLELEKRELTRQNTELSDENAHLRREHHRLEVEARIQKEEKETLFSIWEEDVRNLYERIPSKTQD